MATFAGRTAGSERSTKSKTNPTVWKRRNSPIMTKPRNPYCGCPVRRKDLLLIGFVQSSGFTNRPDDCPVPGGAVPADARHCRAHESEREDCVRARAAAGPSSFRAGERSRHHRLDDIERRAVALSVSIPRGWCEHWHGL